MKMEVLSVQHHHHQQQFQGQFSVIGSNKVKDWASPLTPPATNVTDETSSNHNQQINNLVSATSSTSTTNTVTDNQLNNDNNQSTTANTTGSSNNSTPVYDPVEINELSLRLQSELRIAKSEHLSCTEVLLPSDLLHTIAIEIIKASEKEPCGIRGCTVYIEFEDEPSNTRRIASLKIDPNTVSTFELYLTLKHDRSGWTSILPQFLKNLARSSTIMISPEFILTKNKLYHNFFE